MGLPHTGSTFTSRFAANLHEPLRRPLPDVRAKGHYDWYSFVIEALRQLLINQKYECLKSTTFKKEKLKQVCFWPSPFVHSCGAGCCDCEVINPYYRKRGSASYIVREWLLCVCERERERRLWRQSISRWNREWSCIWSVQFSSVQKCLFIVG